MPPDLFRFFQLSGDRRFSARAAAQARKQETGEIRRDEIFALPPLDLIPEQEQGLYHLLQERAVSSQEAVHTPPVPVIYGTFTEGTPFQTMAEQMCQKFLFVYEYPPTTLELASEDAGILATYHYHTCSIAIRPDPTRTRWTVRASGTRGVTS